MGWKIEGYVNEKAREWKYVRSEILWEMTEWSRGQRCVCMRDQDGGRSDGTRGSSVDETNACDCYQTENALT